MFASEGVVELQVGGSGGHKSGSMGGVVSCFVNVLARVRRRAPKVFMCWVKNESGTYCLHRIRCDFRWP